MSPRDYPYDRLGRWRLSGEYPVNLDFSFPNILDLFQPHLSPKRSRSASFLIWYLENYYRLDAQTAVDSVCDFRGDKGVDGIFVNDSDQTITVFQATIFETQKQDKLVGDSTLREFSGTVNQFRDSETIGRFLESKPSPQLASLVNRLDLINKISTYGLRGEFLCNRDQDANADGFLATAQNLLFVGPTILTNTYISDKRETAIHAPAIFNIIGQDVATYTGDTETKVIIAAVKATELVKMDGIPNQSLYKYNVRGPLGRSSVNKAIRATITKQKEHKNFPLFHNGITIIAKTVEATDDFISIGDYYVVNGCQSLTALFENQKSLTDDLKVLTKFIQLDPESSLAEKVTRFSNNQNAVKDRDLLANDKQQIRLQNEFREHYPGEYYFEIKRGELPEAGTLISNEVAGLLLRSFDLKEPETAHRVGEVLDPLKKYSDVFMRTEVNADRILLFYIIYEVVSQAISTDLENDLMKKYNLTKYVLVFIVRNILEKDVLFTELTTSPKQFVRDRDDRERFRECLESFVNELIVDVNAAVSDEIGDGREEDFDYREKLRNADFVRKLSSNVVRDYLKQIKRKRIVPFSDEWARGVSK